MIGWLLYTRRDAKKNSEFIRMMIDGGNTQDLNFVLVCLDELSIGNKENSLFIHHKKNYELPDFVVNRSRSVRMAKQFELLGIPVFNSSQICKIGNDKAESYQIMAAIGITCVPTSFYQNHSLTDLDLNEKQVIKTIDGHGGTQVFLGNYDYHTLANEMRYSDFVVQPRIGGKGEDVRVFLIGNEIIAGVKRTSQEGFRSNYSQGGQVQLHNMTIQETSIIHKICNHFSFDYVGIDFIIDEEGKWLFNEIEDAVGARMLYQCSNVDIVQQYLIYIKKQMKYPERRFQHEI